MLFLMLMALFPSKASSLKAKWTALHPSSKIHPKRSGHVAFRAGERLFVFGGYAEDDDMNRYVTNDLWEWNANGWIEQTQTGQLPGPRLVSAAVVLNESPYLMGGWDPKIPGTGGIILDDVSKLEVPTGKWTTLETAMPDGPTSRHIALAFQETKAFLHNHRCMDHVWILNGETDEFTKQQTSGTAPSSRGLHCATMAGDHVAVLWGGAAKDGIMSNEAFLLDTNEWKWTFVETGGPCPTPRAGASLCCYSDDCVLLFGGAETTEVGLNPRGDVWALHFDAESGKGQWELLLPDDRENGPEPRNAATLFPIGPLDDKKEKCYLLTGGWAPFRQTWNDCFVLRVSDD